MSEFDKLYELLEKYPVNYSVENRIKLSATGKRLKSLLLGVRSTVGAYQRKDKTLNPNILQNTITPEGNEIYKHIEKIIHKYYANFEFNQIIINKNSTFLIHKDKGNKNDESLIFTVGEFEGGDIELYHNIDSKPYNILKVKNTPTIFNGKLIYHATQAFTGNRYCVVAYLNKIPLKYIAV